MTRTLCVIGLGCAAAVALPLALAGCGGGSDGPPPPPNGGPLPKNPIAGGAPQRAGYEVGAVSNGGSITGAVKWTGGAYTAKPLDITKDTEVCQHPGAVDQSLTVDNASKGVANVVVYLTKIGKGKAWGTAGLLDNAGCLFQPQVLIHGVGAGALTVKNSDPVNHNTHLFPSKNVDFNKMLGSDSSVAYGEGGLKVEKRPFKVKCDVHGWMESWLWPVGHPYYELSGKDGSFTIADIPPGTYQVAAWHGLSDEIVNGPQVTVAAGQAASVGLTMGEDGALTWK